jgi:hypothetical protein
MVAGAWVAGGDVGELAVGFDPPVVGLAAVSGRPLGILQAERTRIDTRISARNRLLISLLSILLINFFSFLLYLLFVKQALNCFFLNDGTEVLSP